MPYVTMNEMQRITAVFSESPPNATEWIADDDPRLIGLFDDSTQARDSLSQLDADMIRVVEDLIELLITKNIILPTELPEAAQRKLAGRQQLRQQLAGNNPMLDESDII